MINIVGTLLVVHKETDQSTTVKTKKKGQKMNRAFIWFPSQILQCSILPYILGQVLSSLVWLPGRMFHVVSYTTELSISLWPPKEISSVYAFIHKSTETSIQLLNKENSTL